MSLSERLVEYVRACFTGLWVESHEHEDALVEIAATCREHDWRLAVWDIDRGLQMAGMTEHGVENGGSDPLAAIRALGSLASPESSSLLVLVNFHLLINSAETVQALAHQISAGKQNRTFVVVLSPVIQLPTELEKQFVVIEHELPSREQLAELARGIATEDGELPSGADLEAVLDASAGLTRYEAEGAFSLALVRHGRIEPETIWRLKSQMLKKSGLLSLHEGTEKFDDLGGLDSLKSFCTRALRRHSDNNAVRPRGVLLLSPPGCGKSAFAKALGNEIGRPTLTLDIGSLFGSLVGQSEQNVRRALRIADAMAPCVLFVDEIEKGLSGVASSGQSDSGVSARLFGNLLTWLNDHQSDVFFIGTCNDISKLPPEFSRAERFDGVFFLDLPGTKQREAIWQMYRRQFGIDTEQSKPRDQDWTGAEIRACCRLAALLEVPLCEAAENIVPVAVTAAESVDKLRHWANGRCLSADLPGMYRPNVGDGGRQSRKVSRDAARN